jgi:hypothetical protein
VSGDHGVGTGERETVTEKKTFGPGGDTDATSFVHENTNGLAGFILLFGFLMDQTLIVIENEGNADMAIAISNRAPGKKAFHCIEIYWVPPIAPL